MPSPPPAVPNMPQQRSDQHHPQGTPTMMHPATVAGPPIVAQSPAYSAQYFTCSPQQFTNQPLVQQMTHYQSQVSSTAWPAARFPSLLTCTVRVKVLRFFFYVYTAVVEYSHS